jgi:hypothetical protein
MTEGRQPRRLPVSHLVSRVLLATLVASMVVAAVVLAILHGASELAFGDSIWGAVKHWTLPW